MVENSLQLTARLFKLLIALCAVLTTVPGMSGLAHATQITENSYEDIFPSIRGNNLVWQGRVDGDWEIFAYDIAAAGTPIQITHNTYDDISPQTDGSYVVWLGYSQSGGEIFLYDLSKGGAPVQITNDGKADSPPQIANGRVVWTSHQVSDSVEPGEIVLYDIAAGQPTQLTNNTLDDSAPRINDQTVMWVEANGTGKTVYIYDLTKPVGPTNPAPAPEGFVWTDSPQTDGNLTVLARRDGSDREIFVHNTTLNTYEQLTDNDGEDSYPRISGNNVAWVSGKGQASEIFLLALAQGGPIIDRVRPRACEPGETIRIIGHNFGESQGGGIVHISNRTFDAGSGRIKLWTDTRIKIRISKYKDDWFKGQDSRPRKIWVTVNGKDSNKKKIHVNK